jgi:hypothetical protein
VVQYQQPSYKPENPFNGQSYIIEPSYLLKPYRPETTYHAQPYRPHNPAPYPPSYQAPAYPSYQVPTYPAPVYNQAPAYQPYPAPVYQSQGPPTGSSVILVLAGNTIQPTQTYSTTESSVSPSQVQSVVETVVVESVTVKWSDILSADANELGQKYSDNSKKEKKEKDVKESEEKEEDDDEEDDEKPSTSSTKESDSGAKKQDNNGSQEQQNSNSENVTRPISYPIPANLTSKAVWKIPKTVASYVQSADDGPGTKPDESAGDKSGDDSPETPIQNEKVYSTESENEESSSSKSSLTDNTNQVGITTENKESSETTTADQVTKISLQQQGGGGELANNEGRTYHQQSASQDNNNNEESAAVELVNQVALQQEKPKSGSSVYYEQGPTNAGQEEASSSLNEPGAEISQQDVDSEEAAGTETTPVISNQVSYQPQTGNESAEKPDVSKVISETPSVTEEYLSLYPSQPSIYQQGSQKDNNNKLLDESEETSTDAPAVEVSSEKTNPLDRQEPVVAPADKDESKEIVTVSQVPDVNIHETERPAYLAPYKPVVPKIFRPKVESEEVEPPETGFGERIKAFTKFALAIQKATQEQQGIYQQPALANTEPISLTPSVPYKNEQVLIHPTEENNNTFESVSTTNAQETSSAENDQLLKVHQPVSEYPATEAPLPSTYEASLFYKKPVAPETVAPLQEQQELSTEGPYKFKPLFYAQAVEKFAVEPIKYEEPDQSAKTSYDGRIVAEKMSPDQPVQVINAFHQYVYSSGPSTIEIAPPAVVSDPAPSIIQQPVLDRDPMEKTENYATQRIYTASAEIPGDSVASSTPSSYYIPEENNPYVSPAYIEEAGLSAEYQKEIAAAAAAQKEAEYVPQTSEESQTEIPDVYREEAYSTETAAIVNSDPVKVKSTEDISAEVTESYQEKSEAVSAIQVKSAEELGSSEVTDSPYQAISYETVTTGAPKIQAAEEVSAEIVYTPVTESIYQEKTSEIPFLYDTVPAKTKSEEDVSSEVIVPVTDQYETTESYPDVPLTKYQQPPAIITHTQELIPSVAPPYYEIQASTSEPESATFVVGTMLQVGDSSSESNEKTFLMIQQPDEQMKLNVPHGSLPGTEHVPPCQTDKSVATGNHFHQFLFNPASLANVPLDSGESSDEDSSTLAPTTVVPDLNTPSTAPYNESTLAETSTVASDGGYKYVFKSRPTPNRFYESRSTTAIPSTNNSTTSEPPTSRRPFVVIGKPIEMRKPINGRIYSRPLPVPQRKPQTLAQIKILPTRLRSSTSTIQLPNRRFFIGRTLTMTNEKNNRDSKEEETKKEA